MTTMVDLDTGVVWGVVDGRGSAGVKAWLTARSPAWRAGVQVVAIDPSAAFRKAITDSLPHAAVSVDHFYADVPVMPMWSVSSLLRGMIVVAKST
jgi:transposase